MTRDLKHRASPKKQRSDRRGRFPLLLGGAIILGAGLMVTLTSLALKKANTDREAPATLAGNSSTFSYFRVLEDRERQIDESEVQLDARNIRNGRSSTQGHFTLLIGTYRTREEAEAVREAVKRHPPLKPQAEGLHLQFSTWYRITLGPYRQLSDAIKVRQFLKAQGRDSVITTPVLNESQITD